MTTHEDSTPSAIEALAGAYRCPDCAAPGTLSHPDPTHPVWLLVIAHEDTCPTYRANLRRRHLGTR